MAAEKQRTLAGEAVFSGVGLHGGKEARIVLRPAEPDSGLRMAAGGAEKRLAPSLCAGGGNCNTVTIAKGVEVMTVEHLLSAVWGMGVDNLTIGVDGPEIPGLDGSALEFVKGIEKAGIVEQDAERRTFIPRDPVSVGDAKAGITAYPAPDGGFSVTYTLDYPESAHARGTGDFSLVPESYRELLAPARTFVMRQHADAMLAAGLGKGANPQNTVVLDGDAVVGGELRFADECLRHKVLDLVGDLSVVNRRLGVHIVARRSGHRQNVELARKLWSELSRAECPRGVMDIRQILRLLPHRYPFLLVDRVIELEERQRILALKNLTGNETFFQGHFPGQPIMPGVLQIEALAQAGAIMLLGEFKDQGKLALIVGCDGVRWRRQVVPGDALYLHVEADRFNGRIGAVRAWGTVDGDVTVEAMIKFAIIDAAGAMS
ncbi:MAG: 3-hydroxyacyl-ACP dehydratase FabZ [Planctomycetota bacterium]|jgi:UDP-3-O-[3-hydroxymyristoyl] N-acetylglucosamine deacetylase/3-hydroxyacyl-[acyl-carrier-protein] dehydratase|nr:3-hydroxyacyl-ACP dehydratase FabZ [Planctomycetota bacterium]